MKTIFAFALAFASTLALANIARADIDPASAVRVSLSDIDLSTAQGQRIAQARVHKAAQTACTRSMDPYRLAPHYEYVNCVASSEKSALQQIQPGPVVAAR